MQAGKLFPEQFELEYMVTKESVKGKKMPYQYMFSRCIAFTDDQAVPIDSKIRQPGLLPLNTITKAAFIEKSQTWEAMEPTVNLITG